MLLSKKTLLHFLPELRNKSFEEINQACFNLGMEVEQVLTHPVTTNLCVGLIQKVENITGSDKLHLATVLIDEKNEITKQIICGAKELKVNWKVVVANPGAKLYDGRVIEAKTLMNVTSQGMLCGYSELTPLNHEYLDQADQQGIVVLDEWTPVGATNINELLGLDDTIYDLSLPTNRHDYSGAVFLINDLARFFNTKFHINEPQTCIKKQTNLPDLYCSCIFSIKNKLTSPWSINQTLLNNGIKLDTPILNFVNYYSFLTGVYPLIVDADLINGEIKVANYTGLVTINNTKYELKNDQCLMVNNTVVAIDKIGVVDQFKPNVNTKNYQALLTKTNNQQVRQTAIRLNLLNSFVKNNLKVVDQYQINLFLKYLSQTFTVVSNSYVEIRNQHKAIPFNLNACSQFTGINDQQQILKVLEQWNYQFDPKQHQISVPSYRSDLVNEHDVAEEVLKLYTFEQLPVTPIIAQMLQYNQFDHYQFLTKLKTLLTSHYINEAKTYNLTSKEELNQLNYHDLTPLYHINPCSNTAREYMRLSLGHNLLKVLSYNFNHKNDLLPIFEIQKIYNKDIFTELTIIAPEVIIIDAINNIKANFNTFGLKNLANEIANLLKINFTFKKSSSKYLYDNDNLAIFLDNKKVGFCGCIRANILKDYKLNQFNLFILNINLKNIVEHTNSTVYEFDEFNENPLVYRDITFNVDKTKDLSSLITNLDKLKFINNYQFTKAYHLNDQEIAYTIHLGLSNKDKQTLTKEEIDSYINEVNDIIKNSL